MLSLYSILYFLTFELWTYIAVLSTRKGIIFLYEQIVLRVVAHDFLNIWPTVRLISIPAAKSSQSIFVTKWNRILPDLPGGLCVFWQCQRDEAGTEFFKKAGTENKGRGMLPYGIEGLV